MFPTIVFFFFFFFFFYLTRLAAASSTYKESFTFDGFIGSDLQTDGIASIMPNGLLRLTDTTKYGKGHGFHRTPFNFDDNNSTNGNNNALSFSTTFVFAILHQYRDLSSHGIAFVLSPSPDLSSAFPSQYLGLFNSTTNGSPSNRIIAVELDTNYNPEFRDIDNDHVGIDVYSLDSINASHASYYDSNAGRVNLSLVSGDPMQVWIEYDHREGLLNVTLAPLSVPKPSVPLLSSSLNLPISNKTYVGFSAASGSFPTLHFILGWSFSLGGIAPPLDLARLPSLPRPNKRSKFVIIGVPVIAAVFALAVVAGVALVARRKAKFAEVLEDWELEYGPQRFLYKDIYIATKGFKDKELLGVGGFGRVYKGVLPKTNTQIAVKKVSHESRQGMREFIAEIVSIGKLRHRNLVQLLGYCRRRGELMLVYDYMPNGSLDRFLFDQSTSILNWNQRFRIIKNVASGLFYLHEEWEQMVIHRDIKASNVLLDGELNGRLGDFGLSRLYDHGSDPQTTHVVGTLGYLAPELPSTGKATTCTDVYAFGGLLLEVACGRRPIETRASPEEMILVDWVLECWKGGTVLEARDPNLGHEYSAEEMDLVLKLGLLCSHPNPRFRPRMRLVIQVLQGNSPIPEIPAHGWGEESFGTMNDGFDDYAAHNV